MVLAARLAHLVRRGFRGVGRKALGAHARTPRWVPRAVIGAFCGVMLCGGFVLGLGGSAVPAPHRGADSASTAHHAGDGRRTRSAHSGDGSGNAMLDQVGATETLALPAATTTPQAIPATLVDAPPLASRENFAFAPYWTLAQSPTFSLTGLSTIAYFSIGVNPNGTLDESGAGWDGFESQDLTDLISRAHAAGERVVLTVNDFGQSSLDQLTSMPSAAGTLSSALVPLLQAKSLDGVNFDFEGDGSQDQRGLTDLVTAVSGALRQADPHWQITMDTYASSAGDTNGFYNIPALAPAVDAFFVMDYELNLAGTPSAASPLTSGMFSSLTTLKQYTAAVPASKVILGLPFFGIDWPSTNGTMAATPAGGASDIPDSQAQGNGPEYWDPVTGTSWTSYQVGGQWHESYYEGEYGLFKAAQMATWFGARGVGIWALGMENDGAQLIAALDGISPGGPPGAGPSATSASPAAPAPGAPPAPAPTGPAASAAPPSTSSTTAPPAPASAPAPTTTTTTVPTTTAVYNGAVVTLTPVSSTQVATLGTDGTVTDFESNVPAYTCLNGQTLSLSKNLIGGKQVARATTPSDCINQDFELP
jgi:hypothetical protein